MARNTKIPTIDKIITATADDTEHLNSLYETLLMCRVSNLSEALTTVVVVQNPSYSGITGPIYDLSGERTVNIQTGKSGGTTGPMPQSTGDTSGNY